MYDLWGRRVAKLLDTDADSDYDEETHYLLDGERHERGHAGDHIVLTFNANGDLTNRYLHGPAVDQILADEQIDDVLGTTVAGEVLWPLTDNLSTVRDIADFDSMTDTTTVVNHITYGVYGVITAETNSTIKHAFAFTGRERDCESGLHHYRERYYAGSSGVFLTEDPIGFTARDTKLDRYGSNDPVNVVDPNGLWEQPVELLWAPPVITPGPVHPGGLGFNPQLPNGDSFWSWMRPALWRACVGGLNPNLINGGTIGVEYGGTYGFLAPIYIGSFGGHLGYDPAFGNDEFTFGLGPQLGVGAGPYASATHGLSIIMTNAGSVGQLSGWGIEGQVAAGPTLPSVGAVCGSGYVGASAGLPGLAGGVQGGVTHSWFWWYSSQSGGHWPTWIAAPPIPSGGVGPSSSIPQHQTINPGP